MHSPRVHAIVGPTGVGKSSVATQLARVKHAPVVVIDRIQCFTDLVVSSGRSAAEHDTDDVPRYYLGERSVQDGDFPAGEAVQVLFRHIEKLGLRYPLVIIEGGSISILQAFMARRKEFPFNLTCQIMRIHSESELLAVNQARIREMLHSNARGESMISELARAWKFESQRRFLRDVIGGFDAILDWCAERGLEPEELSAEAVSMHDIDELVTKIGARYLEYALRQEGVFDQIFQDYLAKD